MALASLLRRTTRLEQVFVMDTMAGYPPLTSDEIAALAQRMADGDQWTDLEKARVIKQCPYIHGGVDGSVTINVHTGNIYVKRIIGVDMSLL